MEELLDFYDANIDDPKAMYLEKLRLKLKRALQYKFIYDPDEAGPNIRVKRTVETTIDTRSIDTESEEDEEDDIEREETKNNYNNSIKR